MKHALIIGTVLSKSEEDYYYKNGIKPAAADNAQKYLINGLIEQNYYDRINVISGVRLTVPFPKSPIKKAPGNSEELGYGLIQSVSYPNIFGIGYQIRRLQLLKVAKEYD